MLYSEFAPAKINLTLEVLGRRPDGYHEIRSLVAFAQDVGDRITFTPGRVAGVETTGPFAGAIDGDNLVDKASAEIQRVVARLAAGRLILEKNLPVASGIGGGSTDAAAALRVLIRVHGLEGKLDLAAIARKLGADVPVCLAGRAALMTGVGEIIGAVAWPVGLFAVLANPLERVVKNKTAEVFARLGAPPVGDNINEEPLPEFASAYDVISYSQGRANALEGPARQLFPALDKVLSTLSRLDNCRLARLSGAGPTCFALFDERDAALSGAAALARFEPDWWIRTTRLA